MSRLTSVLPTREPAMNGGDGLVDAAVDAERQAVAGGGDGVEHAVKGIAAPADDMQDRIFSALHPRRSTPAAAGIGAYCRRAIGRSNCLLARRPSVKISNYLLTT
jgi:hypothetical protein